MSRIIHARRLAAAAISIAALTLMAGLGISASALAQGGTFPLYRGGATGTSYGTVSIAGQAGASQSLTVSLQKASANTQYDVYECQLLVSGSLNCVHTAGVDVVRTDGTGTVTATVAFPPLAMINQAVLVSQTNSQDSLTATVSTTPASAASNASPYATGAAPANQYVGYGAPITNNTVVSNPYVYNYPYYSSFGNPYSSYANPYSYGYSSVLRPYYGYPNVYNGFSYGGYPYGSYFGFPYNGFAGAGVTARCTDGTYTNMQTVTTVQTFCSTHGGVMTYFQNLPQ